MKWLNFLTPIFMAINSYGQENITISGLVTDSMNNPIISANIWFISGQDSILGRSSENGFFMIKNIKQKEFSVRVEALGYQPWNKKYSYPIGVNTIQLPIIILSPKFTQLQEFIVKGKQSAVLIKGDTLEYKISQYNLREHSVVEDLLKRLPGLTVDANGNISYMGQPITRIKINGHEFFVSNIQMLTRLLPTDFLDKVQLIQDYGEMARITGRKTGTPEQVLNLQTQNVLDKTRQIQISSGIGNKDRYNTALTGIFLSQKEQAFLVGNINNTNTIEGNNKTQNAMISWSKSKNNLTLNFNSSWENFSSKIIYQSNSKIISQEGTLFVNETNNNNSTSNVLNLYASGEYNSTTSGNIKFLLRGNINNLNTNSIIQQSQSGLQLLNKKEDNSSNEKDKISLVSIIYSKELNKKGRVISANINSNNIYPTNKLDDKNSWNLFTSDTSKVDSIYHQIIYKNTNNLNTNLSISIVEPITAESNIEIRYAGNKINMHNSIETYKQPVNAEIEKIDTLSNNNKYKIFNNQVGLSYKKARSNFDIILGANVNIYKLKSISSEYSNTITGSSILPSARLQYQLSHNSSIVISYIGSIDFPTYQQIQPVPDNTNYQFPIIGNPDLKPTKFQAVTIDYRKSGSSTYFFNLRTTFNNNKIVSNIISIKDTSGFIKQVTHYLNTNGDYSMNLNYGYDKQFLAGKFQASFEGNDSYGKNIIFMEDIKSSSKNIILDHRIKLSTYLDWIEVSTTVRHLLNQNTYLFAERNTTNLQTWNLNMSCNLFFLKTWNIRIYFNKQFNEGLNKSENSNPTSINTSLEKSFLKKALTCKLQGFNLLNQSSNISQNVTSNTITQSKSNLIGSYFLFTVMLDLKKISSK